MNFAISLAGVNIGINSIYGEVYELCRGFMRKNCLSENRDVAAAHAVEYEDVVICDAEATKDLS